MAEPILLCDAEALARTGVKAITALTEAATRSTFYRDGLSDEELAAIRRVVDISAPCCIGAAKNDHQLYVAAFAGDRFAGYVIATRHAGDDLELDWMMVDPASQGTGVAAKLMEAGIEWLGADQPMWLNVIAHNARAIAFYRRFGFEIDPDAKTAHVVPHHIMRRR